MSCTYGIAWHGLCRKDAVPGSNPERCGEHITTKCTGCGAPAVEQCAVAGWMAVCGYPICDGCTHFEGGHRLRPRPVCDGRCIMAGELVPGMSLSMPAYPDPYCSLHGESDGPLQPWEEEMCPPDPARQR